MRCNACHAIGHQTEACSLSYRVTGRVADSLFNDDDVYNMEVEPSYSAQEKLEDDQKQPISSQNLVVKEDSSIPWNISGKNESD